jgi:hypothetical protein
MSDRTQDDGTTDKFVARIAPPMRAAERLDEGFEARVMLALDTARFADARASAPSWWRRPRTVTLSPLGGLAMAAGLAGLVALGALAGRATAASGAVAADARVAADRSSPDTVHLVRFVFVARDAEAVSLVGDFNGWQKGAAPLAEPGEGGLWTVSVPVPPGRHEYAFIVRRNGGEDWVADPFATKVVDEFRTESSVISVAERTRDRATAHSS